MLLKNIKLQDTTLRDGEQTPGVAYSLKDKLELTEAIISLGVDSIEIGFPAASEEEAKIIEIISSQFNKIKTEFVVFSRAKESDIEIAYNCLQKTKNKKIQIVAPASDLHILHSTKENKSSLLKNLEKSLIFAKEKFSNIQFTAQDAPRADITFLKEMVEIAISKGVQTICLPDTTGFCLPNDYADLISTIKGIIDTDQGIMLSAHCHNDLGLATANTIAAINAGADQIEGTINGIGERAGNTPIEEIVAILDLKYKGLLSSNLNLSLFKKVSKQVEKITCINTHVNKPIFGKNVFMHASGMHQRAMIENSNTFEIINSKKFGIEGGNIAIGKLSGRAGVQKVLDDLSIKIDPEKIDEFLAFIKNKSVDLKEINNSIMKNLVKDFINK